MTQSQQTIMDYVFARQKQLDVELRPLIAALNCAAPNEDGSDCLNCWTCEARYENPDSDDLRQISRDSQNPITDEGERT